MNNLNSKPNKLSRILTSLRPWSFSASLIPVAIGSALAYKSSDNFNVWVFLFTLLTVLSVHAAGNLVNTYYDFMKGIDSKRSDDRTLVDHILTPDEVNNLGMYIYMIGCLAFALVVWFSPAKMVHLAGVYFCGLSSSFFYTGGIGLKYIALGDVIIMLTFGPVSVLFSFMAQTGQIDFRMAIITLAYAFPLALNTEAILHSNNTRDIESDRRAGAVTIPILIGPSFSHILFALLLFTPYILFVITSIHYTWWSLLPLITIHKAFQIEKDFRLANFDKMPKRVTKLNFYFGLFYLVACLVAPSNQLPGLNDDLFML